MRRMERCILLGFVLSVVLSCFTAFANDCEYVRENTLRLHILANSNSESDQALKLHVRDSLLEQAGDLFGDSADLDAAKVRAEQEIGRIRRIAEDAAKEWGSGQAVTAQVVRMYFDTRFYDNNTYPAGMYDAVRITLGQGAGQNWWCVMFPPLCIPCAQPQQPDSEKPEEAALKEKLDELTSNEPRLVPKFAVVELWESIFDGQD